MDDFRAQQYASELIGKDVGGWRILEYINHGKSAVVFKASNGKQLAALKVIDRDLEAKYGRDKQQGRIELEAQLVGKVHPHLVAIYGAGRCTTTDLLFVAMEFLPHKNLEDYVPTFSSHQIWSTIEKIASAAEFLEKLDIVHRDIKPANIAVSDDFSTVKLLDLGICRPSAEDSGNGTGNHFIGTLRYSPPEFVWREEKRTTEGYRSITFYQLGAVLHDMIMRRRMFHTIDKPEAKLYEAVRGIEPELSPAEQPPEGLIRLAKSCLVKNPDVRLKIVQWSSFKQPTGQQNISAIKDEMAMRQRHLDKARSVGQVQVDAAAVLSELVTSLDFAIRDIVQQSGLYPPHRIERHSVNNDSLICASFPASEKHELQSTITFAFLMSLIDTETRVVLIKFAAVARGSISQFPPTEIAQMCAEKGSEVYTGLFEITDLKAALDMAMLKKLQAATEIAPRATCQVI